MRDQTRDVRNTKLRKLEFSVFRNRPQFASSEKPLGESDGIVIAVSGGADSVALLHILAALRKRWGFRAEVAYVHHGERVKSTPQHEKINRYRKKAELKVKALAKSLDLPFVALRAAVKTRADHGESEEALREARLHALSKHAKEFGYTAIALGHHADDLFETRLIRLIRGTGPQGLSAMRPISRTESGSILWRPLLQHSRAEIEVYLSEKELHKNRDWIVDPSNRDARYLRNDIRRRLIPLLEKVRPGGGSAMARSLQLMADHIAEIEAGDENPIATAQVQNLSRSELLGLAGPARRSRFAKWLKGQGIRDISQLQIDEILKRIDTPQKRLTFAVGGRVWMIDTMIRIDSTSR